MKKIPLSNSPFFVLVDDWNYERVIKYVWFLNGSGYITCNVGYESWMLHRFILNLYPGDKERVDHIHRIKLDCREEELRICSHGQNMQNAVKRKNATSKYKGVSWCNTRQGWVAKLMRPTGTKYLGIFTIEEDAAEAYRIAALQYFGEFARV